MVGKRCENASMDESVLLEMPCISDQLNQAGSLAYFHQLHPEMCNEISSIEDAGNGVPACIILLHVLHQNKPT
jgi:hypothetical protein